MPLATIERANQEERYKLFYRPVRRICFRYLGNDAEAEDAAQETFVRAFAGYSSQKGPFFAYAARVATNYCIDILRRRKKEAPLEDNVADSGARTSKRLRRLLITTCLENLPDDQRLVLKLYHLEGYTHDEIVAATDLTKDQVRRRIALAKSTLEKCMDDSSQKLG